MIHIVAPEQAISREPGRSDVPTVAASQIPPVLLPAEPLYRACGGGGRDHFFTTNKEEWDYACREFGYSGEGTACKLWTTQAPGMVPLYRLWNGADHFYTSDEQEKNGLRHPWNYEGIPGYILSTRTEGTVPFYRMFFRTNGDHHYTVNEEERSRCINGGQCDDEGYVGFVFPP